MENQANDRRTRQTTVSDSRRGFLKTGALAAGAVALGLPVGTAAAQQRDDVLVFTDDYSPGSRFRVVSLLPAAVTVRLLQRPGGGTVPEISQPDDYNGYAIRYETSGGIGTGGSYVFTRGSLDTGTRYRFTRDATIFSSQLSLVSTQANRSGN
jgi:hypothetical protein